MLYHDDLKVLKPVIGDKLPERYHKPAGFEVVSADRTTRTIGDAQQRFDQQAEDVIRADLKSRIVAAVRSERQTSIDMAASEAVSDLIAARANECGLWIEPKVRGKYGVRDSHFAFFRDRHCVANYWPSTNTLRIGAQSRTAATLTEALKIVALFVGPTASTGPHGPRPRGKTVGRRRRPLEATADKPEPSLRARKKRRRQRGKKSERGNQ